MRLRHTLACLGLAGALVTGGAATASAIASDSMSQAITGRSGSITIQSPHLDESFVHHADDNGDDIGAVSLAGLEVQIELPKDLVEPIVPVGTSPAAVV